MRLFALLLLLIPAVALATPAPDRIAAYRALVQRDLRLAMVSYRLASANAPFCKKLERNPGWVLHDERQYPDREVARAAFGFRQPVAVSAVVPGGAADKIGIKTGDGLAGLNDVLWIWPVQAKPKQSARRMQGVQGELRQAFADGPVTLELDTSNGAKRLRLDPPQICASRFWVDASSKLDAGADGNGVRVTEGLMAFTDGDDDQFAAAVAHELAHNLLAHREQLNAKGGTKAVLATEIEADRLSVWLMANAGYDPKAALRFAERYGRKTSLGIFSEGTHLRWKNRVRVMQAEIDLMADTPKRSGQLPPPLLAGG
ncbi:MAG: hypothetical protein ACRETL_15055 [Gammaproteobacteria bacterium]